jgi:hypothetical protein
VISVKLSSQKFDSALNLYNKNLPQEKLYLHFDNISYANGQTIWYKAYLMSGVQPSQLSKNLYVDWYDNNGVLLSSTVTPIAYSYAAGHFKVPDNYLIIDTDNEIGYNELKKILKDNNLYVRSTITKSFTGKEKNIPYKRHFIFKIEDKEKYKKYSKRTSYGKYADIFYNSWGLAEFLIKKIPIEDIPVLNYDIFNSIISKKNGINPFLTIMNFKISFKTWLKHARNIINIKKN